MKQSCGIGHSASKRRPIDLTSEQAASVTVHPRIQKLAERASKLPTGREKLQAVRKVRAEKQRLKRQLKQQIREEWTDTQAVDDIEHQLQGQGFTQPVSTDTNRPQRPAQKRLVEALTATYDGTIEGYYRYRDDAIDAIVIYCSVEEGHTMRRVNTLAGEDEPLYTPGEEPAEDTPLFGALLSVFISNEKERPRRCFLCVGAARSLQQDDPHVQSLIREFYTSGDLSKHFKRRHLQILGEDARPECQVCDFRLDHKMHLQSHAMRVHGTVS